MKKVLLSVSLFLLTNFDAKAVDFIHFDSCKNVCEYTESAARKKLESAPKEVQAGFKKELKQCNSTIQLVQKKSNQAICAYFGAGEEAGTVFINLVQVILDKNGYIEKINVEDVDIEAYLKKHPFSR